MNNIKVFLILLIVMLTTYLIYFSITMNIKIQNLEKELTYAEKSLEKILIHNEEIEKEIHSTEITKKNWREQVGYIYSNEKLVDIQPPRLSSEKTFLLLEKKIFY